MSRNPSGALRPAAAVAAISFVAGLALSATATAQIDPSTNPPAVRGLGQQKAFHHEALAIRNDSMPLTALPAAERPGVAQRANSLADQAAVRVDRRSNRFASVQLSQPLVPGRLNDLQWAGAAPEDLGKATWEAVRGYLETHAAALRLDLSELAAPRISRHNGGDFVRITAQRQIGGVPVLDSLFSAAVRGGNLTMLAFDRWGDVDVSPSPAIDLAAAQASLGSYLQPLTLDQFTGKPQLVVVPAQESPNFQAVALGGGYQHRLAWRLLSTINGDGQTYRALVDANSGEILQFRNDAEFAAHNDHRGGASTRSVVGGVYPLTNDGDGPEGTEQAGWPMPFADFTTSDGTSFTNESGDVLACVTGDISTTLAGRYLRMNDNCGAIDETEPGVLDLGTSGGIDCTTPAGADSAGNTHASRTGFYELGKIQEMARSHLPDNTWLATSQMLSNMNINNNCNATSGGNTINFFTSGGGCTNTGEIAGVFDHEWGHSMDVFDDVAGIADPGEGIADIYASLRLNTSCIGRGFRLGANCGGYGDPCVACDGVRDIDWAMRTSGTPKTVADADTRCGSGNGTPCGGSTHCEGAVYGEAVWDLWNRDLQSVYGMDLNTAREVGTFLTFQGATGVNDWFTCNTAGEAGCDATSGYQQYLLADDDDGNLNNGTPHMQAIFDAFDRHGAACSTPTVQDSGCAGTPTTAPTVAAAPLDRAVSLTWGAVAGTTTYQIFRAEGIEACEYGKTLVGETADTSFLDDNLLNGREYSYIVIPKGGSASCFGPSSSCTSVTPVAGASLAMVAATATLTETSGDGDPFVDNGEAATFTVAVDNIGSGASTNVRLVSATVTSHPEFIVQTAAGTVYAASLTDCGRQDATIEVVADGLTSLGEPVTIQVELTSDELSPRSIVQEFTFTNTAASLESFGAFTFDFEAPARGGTGDSQGWALASGTFDVDTPGNGGTGNSFQSSSFTDSTCDQIVSPLFIPTATTTLELATNFAIEGDDWDRANVAVAVDGGARTVVDPDGGRLYNTGTNPQFSACTEGQNGWGDVADTWATSSWSNGALGMTPGVPARLEVTFGTDVAVNNRGFWFDDVVLTDVEIAVFDPGSPTLFTDGFESGNTNAWSNSTP